MFTNPWRWIHHSCPNFSTLIKNVTEMILPLSPSPAPTPSLPSLWWLILETGITHHCASGRPEALSALIWTSSVPIMHCCCLTITRLSTGCLFTAPPSSTLILVSEVIHKATTGWHHSVCFLSLWRQRHQLTRTPARSQEPSYGEGLHKLGQRFINQVKGLLKSTSARRKLWGYYERLEGRTPKMTFPP